MSVREGRGPGRNRNRGHKAGPFPAGGGVRGAPSSRPAPSQEGRCPERVPPTLG